MSTGELSETTGKVASSWATGNWVNTWSGCRVPQRALHILLPSLWTISSHSCLCTYFLRDTWGAASALQRVHTALPINTTAESLQLWVCCFFFLTWQNVSGYTYQVTRNIKPDQVINYSTLENVHA